MTFSRVVGKMADTKSAVEKKKISMLMGPIEKLDAHPGLQT